MKHTVLARLVNPFLELMAPERCRMCNCPLPGRERPGICSSCLAEVKYLTTSVCRKCGGVVRSRVAWGALCGECIRRPPPWDRALSVVKYGPPVSELLYRLKYKGDTTVLPALKTILQPFVDSEDIDCRYIIPVPLHPRRLQSRGMNQAVYLAKLLFPDRKQLLTTGLLQRHKQTRPQTGLNGIERRRNLRGAFRLSDAALVKGQKVCVVDDVFTTGTTVSECSRVLRKAGASDIRVLTLARVIPED